MFKIEFSREAAKSMKAMPCNAAATIRDKLEQLAADTFDPNDNVKKLKGR